MALVTNLRISGYESEVEDVFIGVSKSHVLQMNTFEGKMQQDDTRKVIL